MTKQKKYEIALLKAMCEVTFSKEFKLLHLQTADRVLNKFNVKMGFIPEDAFKCFNGNYQLKGETR